MTIFEERLKLFLTTAPNKTLEAKNIGLLLFVLLSKTKNPKFTHHWVRQDGIPPSGLCLANIYFSWLKFLTSLPPHCITNLDFRAEFAHLFCHLSCLYCKLICRWNTDNLDKSTTNQFIATIIQFYVNKFIFSGSEINFLIWEPTGEQV